MKNKIKKVLRNIIKLILVSIILINGYKIIDKQYEYISSDITYGRVRREKNQAPSVPGYLYTKEYDWITITDTKIDYPLIKTSDNGFSLNHNYKGEYDIAGSIFYNAGEEPYTGNMTVIYGHAMRNGSMFKSLHYLRDDHKKFLDSKLYIYTKERKTTYIPVGYKIYSYTDMSYRQIDTMEISKINSYLKQNCNYYNNTEITEDKHIIGLVTCDYSIKEGRLIVFYIEEE